MIYISCSTPKAQAIDQKIVRKRGRWELSRCPPRVAQDPAQLMFAVAPLHLIGSPQSSLCDMPPLGKLTCSPSQLSSKHGRGVVTS